MSDQEAAIAAVKRALRVVKRHIGTACSVPSASDPVGFLFDLREIHDLFDDITEELEQKCASLEAALDTSGAN